MFLKSEAKDPRRGRWATGVPPATHFEIRASRAVMGDRTAPAESWTKIEFCSHLETSIEFLPPPRR